MKRITTPFHRFITNYSIKHNRITFLDDKNGVSRTCHLSWLRDHCSCPLCLHPSTKQKLHSSADVSLTASIKSIQIQKENVTIEWEKNSLDSRPTDVHTSLYSIKELKNALQFPTTTNTSVTIKNPKMSRIEWDAPTFVKNPFHTLDYKDILEPKGFQQLLFNLKEYGLTFIKNVPLQEENVSSLANKIGPIRNTFYGPTWDVKSIPNSKNIAYTNLYLTLHMDLMYVFNLV